MLTQGSLAGVPVSGIAEGWLADAIMANKPILASLSTTHLTLVPRRVDEGL